MCRAIVSLRERGCPGTFLGRLEEGGAHGSDCCEGVVKGGQQVGRARDMRRLLGQSGDGVGVLGL